MEFNPSPLWISLKTTFTATIITFLLGIAAARWMVGYHGKGKALIDGLFTLPLVLPPTVVGFFLLLLLGKNGVFGQLQLGISVIFSWPATVIAATVVAFPLMYKTALGAFTQIDTNLLCAARTLGASEWAVFWKITIPLALPGIMAGTILAFARALGEFGATLMLAGNIPGKTQTIPIAIFFAAEGGEINQALGWVLIIVAISLAATISLNYWSNQPKMKKPSFAHRRLISKLLALVNGDLFQRFEVRSLQQKVNSTLSIACLQVDIQKTLPSWTLETTFSTDTEPLGVLGASGAGKSMLLRCIAGLETPAHGRIVLNKRVLFDAKQKINLSSRDRRIGFVFQDYALFPHLTVCQNIAFGLQKLSKLELHSRVNEQITKMQLQGLENRYPQQLSGGQQQRVALARALAIQPEALLLDEPFSALDTHLRSQLEKQLIQTLASYQGVTLFVTHNLEEAYRICKNLLVLSQGKTSAYGSKESVFERPATFTVAQLTGCKNFSRAHIVSPQLVEAVDWGCILRVIEPIPSSLAYVAIRAHHFIFLESGTKEQKNQSSTENTFPCWLVQTSETPHRMTLYLNLHYPPAHPNDYQLQAEVFKEKWATIKDKPFPWYIRLEPLRLFLMRE